LRIAAGLLALLLAPGLVAAETVDELLARHYAARGGLEKIKSVQTVRLTGRMILGPGQEAPFVMELKRPRKMRTDVTLEDTTVSQAFDGTKGWGLFPGRGPEEMPAQLAKEAEAQSDMDGPLVDYKAKGHTVELLGREPFEGGEAHKLKVTLASGDVRTLWLDARTLLESGADARRSAPEGEQVFQTRLSDYRAVDGLMVAHRFAAHVRGGPEEQGLVVEKVELNAPIDDARFAMPPRAKR
jgi:hypothetical protein